MTHCVSVLIFALMAAGSIGCSGGTAEKIQTANGITAEDLATLTRAPKPQNPRE